MTGDDVEKKMNKYRLEYCNDLGCFKTEEVVWDCSEKWYIQNYGDWVALGKSNPSPAAPDYYIIARLIE